MSKRTDIKHILVVGSGPIIIGQACEFDYSGNQAVKALKEEGYEVSFDQPKPSNRDDNSRNCRPYLSRAS